MRTDKLILTVIQREAYAPSVQIEFRDRTLLGRLHKYYLACRSPAPAGRWVPFHVGRNTRTEPDTKHEPRDWREPVSTESALEILRVLKEARIPVYRRSFAGGPDGCVYELFFGKHFGGAHYRWWVTEPPEWQPLAEVVHTLIAHATRLEALSKSPPLRSSGKPLGALPKDR